MEKIENNKENLDSCNCPKCPTYNECAMAKVEKLFCSDETSNDCQFKPNGCVCPACLVHRKFNLQKMYYCVHGPASKIE